MIHVEPRHLKIIQDILSKYPYAFYAFGSRVTGQHKQMSDLDIVFKDNIPSATKFLIESDFDDSYLPFEVDVVNYNLLSPTFQKIIDDEMVLIKEGEADERKNAKL